MTPRPTRLATAAARCRTHARRRAKQRHDLKLSQPLRSAAIAAVLSGRAVFVGGGHTTHRTRWRVVLAGRLMTVVYDDQVREVVTIY